LTLAHPTRVAEIFVGEVSIGMIAEVNPTVLSKYGIGRRVAMAEIDLAKLCAVSQKKKHTRRLENFRL
jgi:phenylalanyl-tRNA synthetase beta subunit